MCIRDRYGYPHVKVSIRYLSQISATAPIFQQYMSFSALFEIPTKDMAQKYGSTVKNLTLAFSPKLLGGVTIHVWKPGKILGQKVNVKFFTVDPYVGGGPDSHGPFQNLPIIGKIFFLKIKTSKIKSEKNIYQTIQNTRSIFLFFWNFYYFFVFFLIFF